MYATQKVKGFLTSKLGKDEADRLDMWLKINTPDTPLLLPVSPTDTVYTLSRSMMVRNALSLLMN